ncbi:unnamed protein product, partial [Prorocentrum cordatum]
MDFGGWLGAANLVATWASHCARAFDISPPECLCRCEVAASAAAGAAPRSGADAPGLELALDRCLGALSAPPSPAPATTTCTAGTPPLCALLPPPAWVGLAAPLLLVGFALGVVSRGCCEPRPRARSPAGTHLRPGAYTGPASPLALGVLIDFFDDPNGFFWHHRLLLQTDGKGMWTAVTPTGSVQVLNLGLHRALPLDRNEIIPAPYRDECFIFDPITAAELAEFVRRGRTLAAVRGITSIGSAAPDTVRRIADPAHAAFASAVPEAAIADHACFVARGPSGLAMVDGHWVHAEAVEVGHEETWRLDKVTAFGRDPRVTGLVRDRRGAPYISEEGALTRFENTKIEHFPFAGPRAAVELLQSLRAQGQSLASHRHEWSRKSGVNVNGAAAREHFFLSEVLRWEVQFDQLDVSMLASTELLFLRLVQIEAAVRRNPEVPDFTGLGVLASASTDESGAATTAAFSQWVADRQKDQATIAKQGRLLREEKEALFELLKTTDLYDTEPQGLEVFDADRLKVLKRPTNPKPLESVLTGHALTQYLESERHLERSAAEVEARIQDGLITPVKPYWDPKLRSYRSALFDFLKGLLACGLGGLRTSIRARIALFFRAKEDGAQRMIVDAQETSQLMREPPRAQLGGPGALRDLDLSETAFEVAGCDPRAADIHIASLDLYQGFYQCRAKRLGRWFGVEFGFPARDWGATACYDEDAERDLPVDGDTTLHFVMEVLCMGFSWALYSCQAIMEDTALAAAGPRAWPPGRPHLPLGGLLREGAPVPLVAPGRPVFSVYVDNGAVIGFDREGTERGLDLYLARLEEMGFIVHDIERAQTALAVVGLRFLGGSQLQLLPTEKYTWRLYLALGRLIEQGGCPGVALERVVGHIVHHFRLMPWGLSALDHCYRLLHRHSRREWGWFSASLTEELRVLKGLVKLVDVDLAARRAPIAFSGDSSFFGCSLSFARAPAADILGANAFGSLGLDIAGIAEQGVTSSSSRRRRTPCRVVEASDSFRALDDSWTDPTRWRNIVKGGWAYHNAIHLKEARVALMQLRRAARCTAVHGMRLLGLTDNLSALLAFMKGRAADFWLRLLARQAAALAIGAEIAWHLRYIESARNCTDCDSRAADRGEVGPGQAILGATRACRLALDAAEWSRPPPLAPGGPEAGEPWPAPAPRQVLLLRPLLFAKSADGGSLQRLGFWAPRPPRGRAGDGKTATCSTSSRRARLPPRLHAAAQPPPEPV